MIRVRDGSAADRDFVIDTARRFAAFGPPPWRSPLEVVGGEVRCLDEFFDLTATTGFKAIYLDIKLAATQADRAELMHARIIDAWQQAGGAEATTIYLMSPHQEIVEEFRRQVAAGRGLSNLRVVWDFERAGALEGTLDEELRDVSTGKTALRSWTKFKDEIAQITRARDEGRLDSVSVWTIDYIYRMQFLMGLGVDAILTNRPALLYSTWQDSLGAE